MRPRSSNDVNTEAAEHETEHVRLADFLDDMEKEVGSIGQSLIREVDALGRL